MGIPSRQLALLSLTVLALAVVAQTDPPAGQPYDDVHVLYAQSFLADPGPGAGNATAANATWMDRMADGGPLNVTYGVLLLHHGSEWVPSEAFLRVAGPGGEREFFGNSCANVQQADGTMQARGEYSSHKRLVNGTIIKDFTPPVVAVILLRDRDANGTLLSTRLATDAGQAGVEGSTWFWTGPAPEQGLWTVRPGSMREAGERPSSWGEC